MTEPSSNVEVVLSSDLFNDDPCLESMSAPALAVLDAYMAGWGWLDSPTKKDCRGVAAALRAAADEVVPESFTYDSGSLVDGAIEFEQGQECRNGVVRAALLAIADELENAQ